MSEPAPADRSQLEALQCERLNRVLRRCRDAGGFYSHKITEAEFKLPLCSLDEFRARMPFTLKKELARDQQDHPPYGSNLTEPHTNYVRYHQTSATTGRPLRWLDTPESWEWMVDNWTRIMREARVTSSDAVFFAFSFGPFLGFWTAFDAARKIGALCIPGGGMSSTGRLQAIQDNRPRFLCCTPTYALRLAEVALEENIKPETMGIETIIVAGEPGGSVPATRKRIETLWGSRVFDHHGMTEIGPVSFDSWHHPGTLHIIETSYLVEVLAPKSDRPVANDEGGELVLTTLGRDASPLIRYRTGDYVVPNWDGKERWGYTEVALPGGILSRIDDMVIVRGVNVYPSAVDELIRSMDGIAEYRVEIDENHAMGEMTIVIEPASGYDNHQALLTHIEHRFRNEYNLRVPIRLVEHGSLPRFELKARRWIRTSKTRQE